MAPSAVHRFWRSAAPALLVSIGVTVLTVVCARLGLGLAPSAFLCLLLIVLLSPRVGVAGSLAGSLVAVASLDAFLGGPLSRRSSTLSADVAVLITFGVSAAVIIIRGARLQRALDESRALRNDLRQAIDTIPTIVWSTAPDGTVDFMNRAWRDFTGLSAEEARRGRWVDTIHPDEAANLHAQRNAAIAAGRAYELDARLRQADGSYRWVLRRAVPLRDENGTIVKWYGTGTDIDDLKRTEVALRESEAYLAEAQRLSQTGSFGWDLSRSELRWSEETFRIFEYDPGADTPTIAHVLRRVHPDDLSAVQDEIDRVTQEAKDWDLDHRLLMPDGRVKHVHVVARAARHASGLEFIGAIMDVTRTRRAEREVRRARERALEARFTAALEERTRLAREIHDTLLQGFTGVALQLAAAARRVTSAETATTLEAVVGLAQRTLDDARQAVWDLRAPALAEGTFAAALRRAAEDAVRGTDLTLTWEGVGAERTLTEEIEAAAARVLQEAIANTIKHADARSVLVRVSYRARSLRLSVTDDGRGFEVDPDFRAYGGHWGLLGMKERAGQLHGTLTVRSAPGQGTTVAIRIPYRAASAAGTRSGPA
jgi:PAS domain S-box-containing protein